MESKKESKINTVTITIKDVDNDGKPGVSIAMEVTPKPASEADITDSIRFGFELMEYINMRNEMGKTEKKSDIIADSGIIIP